MALLPDGTSIPLPVVSIHGEPPRQMLMGLFPVPNSVQAITPLVGQIQIENEAHPAQGTQSGAVYEPS